MPQTLIEQKPNFVKKVEGENKLSISEFFYNTIQGEGISTGTPAAFLRLEGCTLLCKWCDTLDVWNRGNEYSFDEIFSLMEEANLPYLFKQGQRLVLTGGSPLKQQKQLVAFVQAFRDRYKFKPYLEIENECVLEPELDLLMMIDQWNNSPKLANSGMKERARYKPELIKRIAALPNSWFKFVVSSEEDYKEILDFFLAPKLIRRDQIILMPEGITQEELNKNRAMVADLAALSGTRYCDRAHITIWNRETGV